MYRYSLDMENFLRSLEKLPEQKQTPFALDVLTDKSHFISDNVLKIRGRPSIERGGSSG